MGICCISHAAQVTGKRKMSPDKPIGIDLFRVLALLARCAVASEMVAFETRSKGQLGSVHCGLQCNILHNSKLQRGIEPSIAQHRDGFLASRACKIFLTFHRLRQHRLQAEDREERSQARHRG